MLKAECILNVSLSSKGLYYIRTDILIHVGTDIPIRFSFPIAAMPVHIMDVSIHESWIPFVIHIFPTQIAFLWSIIMSGCQFFLGADIANIKPVKIHVVHKALNGGVRIGTIMCAPADMRFHL